MFKNNKEEQYYNMLRNYAAQNTETLPDLLVRKSPPKKEKQKKCRSPQIHGQLNQKICRDHALNKKFPTQKIKRNPLASRITKTAVNQFMTLNNWLVFIRNELLSKDISKQIEFHFAASEQAHADNRSVNKLQVTCFIYNLFNRCNFGKVCMGSFLDTKI